MSDKLFLPALQGSFGNWTYYSALVSLSELVERVGYARQLQSNQRLGDLIQRRLDDDGRAKDIAQYLLQTTDRFFNALVVGVQDGAPSWHPFALSSQVHDHTLGAVVEQDQDLVGYLELRGDEVLFALDGQHRLAGIKRALEENPALATERVAVIFVPHVKSEAGLRRTRSLFISLNKKAVPVKRKDIIVLDEVDLAAVITRQLIDDHPWFSKGQIDFERFGNALPASSSSWTTIGAFYDLNRQIIANCVQERSSEELELAERNRLADDRIQFYRAGVVDFYARLARLDPAVKKVFEKYDPAIAPAARTAEEPHILFRPIGLKIFGKVAAELRQEKSMDQTFRELKRLPIRLDARPFSDTIWRIDRGTMNSRGESLATRLVFYMLGLTAADEKLRKAYADWMGVERGEVRLPNRFAA